MYRANEASRVTAVLEHKLAADIPQMIEAAAQLWVSEAEHEDDGAVAEVWSAIGELDAIPEAVEAGLRLVRARQKLRPAAFIDLVEHLEQVETIVEVAEIALAAGWDPQPYVLAPVLQLIERRHGERLASFLDANRARLASSTAHWLVAAYVLTTTEVGNAKAVEDWFHDWAARPNVPMWIVTAYLATILRDGIDRPGMRVVAATALPALTGTIVDETARWLATLLSIHDLLEGRFAEFAKRFGETRARFAGPARGALATSMLAYVASAKRREPLTEPELVARVEVRHEQLVQQTGFTIFATGGRGVVAAGRSLRAARDASVDKKTDPYWHTADLLSSLISVAVPERYFAAFAELIELDRSKSQRVSELDEEMQKMTPRLRVLEPVWRKLASTRIGGLRGFILRLGS